MDFLIIIGITVMPVLLLGILLPLFWSKHPTTPASRQAEREQNEKEYTYIYIEHGALVRKADKFHKEIRLPLREIQQIRFSVSRDWNTRGNRGIFGLMTIYSKFSSKTVEIQYSSDIYYKHFIYVSSLKGVKLATDMLMEQLSAHNVHCFKDESFDTVK